jgi:hypothetical protein
MFRTSHSVHTLARPEEAWDLIKDVSRWRNWFFEVELVRLHGPLITGMQGLLYFDDRVYTMFVQKCDLGRLEVLINLRFGVKMHFLVDVSSTPPGSRIKLESEISGAMAIISAWRWVGKIKRGLVPSTRRLGALSQETSI